MPEKRNVVLVVLDTVRKDYFDSHASRISDLSDTSFSRARAASSWSVPSHASMFTGELPSDHGVHSQRFKDENDFSNLKGRTFLEGIEHYSVGVSANPYANSIYSFDSLFDEFHDFIGYGTFFRSALSPYPVIKDMETGTLEKAKKLFKKSLGHEKPVRSLFNCLWFYFNPDTSKIPIPDVIDSGASVINDKAAENREEPFFLFLNYMDAHIPLRPNIRYDSSMHDASAGWTSSKLDNWELNHEEKASERYEQNYRDLYAASIDYLDRKVESLISRLEEKTDRPTTLVITADHGHNLGYGEEDGFFNHFGNLSEGVIHVPLELVNPPEGYPENIDGVFSHLELPELLVDLAEGESFDQNLTSEEAASEVIGASKPSPLDAFDMTEEQEAFWDRMIRSVYSKEFKATWDSLGAYSLESKTEEDLNLSKEVLEERNFSSSIQEYKQSIEGSKQSTDAKVKRYLEKLGYR